jgi:DnaK suppressor protein
MDHLFDAAGFDRADIRTELQSQRRRLIDALQRRVARIREDGAETVPPTEEDEGDGYNLDVHLAEIEALALKNINDALARLDNGQHGWCVRCRQSIGAARLRALPFALRCRQCEDKRERAMASRRGGLNRHFRGHDLVPEP